MAIEQAKITTLGEYLERHTLGENEIVTDPNAMKIVDDVTAHYAGRYKDEDSENNEAAIQAALEKFTESANESKLVSINSEDNENPLNAFFQTQEIEVSDDLIKNGRSLINALRRDLNSYPENRQRAKAAIFNSENGKKALSQLFALISINPDDDEDMKSLQKSARNFINEAITAKTQNMTSSYSSADPALKASVSKILSSANGADQFKAIANIVSRAEILKITNPKSKLYKQISKAFGGGDLGKNISDMVHSKIMTLTSTMPSRELDEALQDEDLTKTFNEIRTSIASAYEEKVNDKINSLTDEDVRTAATNQLRLFMEVYKAPSIAESERAAKDLVEHFAAQSAEITEVQSNIDAYKALAKRLNTAAKSQRPSPVVLEKDTILALSDDAKLALIGHAKQQLVEEPEKISAIDITNDQVIQLLKRNITGSGDSAVLDIKKPNINITGSDVQLILNALEDPNTTEIKVSKKGRGKREILSADQLTQLKDHLAKEENDRAKAVFQAQKDATKALSDISDVDGLDAAISDGKISELTVIAARDDADSVNTANTIANALNEKVKTEKQRLAKLTKIKSKVEKSVFMPAAKSVPAVSLTVSSSLLNLIYNSEEGLSEGLKEALQNASSTVLDSIRSKYQAESNPELEKVIDIQRKRQVELTTAPRVGSDDDISKIASTLTGNNTYATALPDLVALFDKVAEETSSPSLTFVGKELETMSPDLTGLKDGEKALRKAEQYALVLSKLEAIKASRKAQDSSTGKKINDKVSKDLPARQTIRSYSANLSRIKTDLEAKEEASREATKKLQELEGNSDIWEAADGNEENDSLMNTASEFFKGIMQTMLRSIGIKPSTFAQPVAKIREENGESVDEEGTPAYNRAVLNFLDSSMQSSSTDS